MKDLYKRNRLHALESNLVQIHNCKSDNPDDNEAAFAILLNKERKQGYDKVFTTLSVIGRLRQEFNIEGNNNWSNKYSDFAHQSHVDTRKIEKAAPSNNTENQQKLNFKFQYLAYGAVLLLVVHWGRF